MLIAMWETIENGVVMPTYRMFGGKAGKSSAKPYPWIPGKSERSDLISAINDPATRDSGIALMGARENYAAFYNQAKAGVSASRGMGAGLAEREFMRKGFGPGGAIFGRPIKGLSLGMSHLHANFGPMGLGLGALATGLEILSAPKRHKLSALVGGLGKAAGFGIGDVLGTIAGGPVIGMLSGLLGTEAGGLIGTGFQMFSEFNRNMRHLNTGGDYQDTEVAYTMRQRAAQEMAGSVMNARQYLGKEALLMHQ